MVAQVLEGLDSRLEFHDLRVVDGTQRSNLIFDLVVPYSYDNAHEMELVHRIMDRVKGQDTHCECVMNLENSFVQKK